MRYACASLVSAECFRLRFVIGECPLVFFYGKSSTILRFPSFLRSTEQVGVVSFLYFIVFLQFWFFPVKICAKGEPSSPTHAVVLSDVPGTASTVDKATSKRILNYLNNIDETMGQLAGLIAKFCDARRPRDRKRSVHPPSDTGESESDFGL